MKLPAPFRASATVLPAGTSILPLVLVPSHECDLHRHALASGRLSTLLRSNMSALSACAGSGQPLCPAGSGARTMLLSICPSRRSSNALTGVADRRRQARQRGYGGWVGEGRTVCRLGSILWLDGRQVMRSTTQEECRKAAGRGALAGERGMCYPPAQRRWRAAATRAALPLLSAGHAISLRNRK